jgi:hypothetical protein
MPMKHEVANRFPDALAEKQNKSELCYIHAMLYVNHE